MRVPFLDLAAQNAEVGDALKRALSEVVDSGRYVLGERVQEFERLWAGCCGAEACVGVGNGLDALSLSLRAMGIGPGDDVLVPSNTYIATWLAVTAVGANPVPVEPDEHTAVIQPEAVEASLTPATKAILPVHLYGNSAPMEELAEVAQQHGLLLLDDAAQGHGLPGVGGRGHLTAFSFYPTKNLGALGDAGAVTGPEGEFMARLRRLRNYGSLRKNEHESLGANSRMDELQAAALLVLLDRLPEWNARRAALAERYLDALGDVPGVLLPPRGGVWHLFVVRVEERDEVRRTLGAQGIETGVYYPTPPHLSGAYRATHGHLRLPVAERLASTNLALPLSPFHTPDQVDRVAEALRAASLCGSQPSR